MLSDERKKEMWERLEKATPGPWSEDYIKRLCRPGTHEFEIEDLRLPANAPTDIRDLLTALEEMEADNAALLDAAYPIVRKFPPYCDATPENLKALTGILSRPNPGTALLQRHTQELAAKDADIIMKDEMLRIQIEASNKYKGVLEAELARTREALRVEWIHYGFRTVNGLDYDYVWCEGCEGEWCNGQPESHKHFIINGVETAGKCPAAPEASPSKEPSNG